MEYVVCQRYFLSINKIFKATFTKGCSFLSFSWKIHGHIRKIKFKIKQNVNFGFMQKYVM